jgi:hypothetical protein
MPGLQRLLRKTCEIGALLWMQIGLALVYFLVLDFICCIIAPLSHFRPDDNRNDQPAAVTPVPLAGQRGAGVTAV